MPITGTAVLSMREVPDTVDLVQQTVLVESAGQTLDTE